MAVSTLAVTVATPKPETLQAFTQKPISSTFRAAASSQSPNSSSFCSKKHISQLGLGVLAASVVSLTPLDATATRIEYYATTADPPCEFNFVSSGLGYCDIAVGSGPGAPYAQLINVSSSKIYMFCFCTINKFLFFIWEKNVKLKRVESSVPGIWTIGHVCLIVNVFLI